MAKRVFEVAKELKVDHRVLMEKCDQLGISVRNYMALLSPEDVKRLKDAVKKEPSAVESRALSDGVKRRPSKRAADVGARRPRGGARQPEKNAPRLIAPVVREAPKEEEPEAAPPKEERGARGGRGRD
ncbi:translation initiation factor IF-2 N-terminal domain-containing protein, partial [Myxococcota bacterium]|nr:translation initiation factor IF-2 N-terminal domain-containing protein [Myxococcota bacterium]